MNKFFTSNVKHFSDITLRIKDKAVMLFFYQEILKLTLLEVKDNDYVLGTKSGTKLITLHHDSTALKNKGFAPLYHFALLLPHRSDLATFLLSYARSGYPFVGASDHFVSEALYLEDPEGNGIEIYVDKDPSIWQKSDGIMMNTMPLDYKGLIKEASKDEYTAIPDGTIMGHLHFHVHDLKNAATFYQDILGFDLVLKYGSSAYFLSDFNYHHHLAFNTWHRQNEGKVAQNTTGLIKVTLSYPLSKIDDLIANLNKYNIIYQPDGQNLSFIGLDNVEVKVEFKKD